MTQSNRTFAVLYEGLPPTKKQNITMEIIQRCNVSLWTIKSWCSGRRRPKASSMEIISEIFNIPASKLFPEAVN